MAPREKDLAYFDQFWIFFGMIKDCIIPLSNRVEIWDIYVSQELIIVDFMRKNNGNAGLKFSFEYEQQQRNQYLKLSFDFDKLLVQLPT